MSAGVRGPCRKTWKWAQTHAALVTSSGTFFSCSLHQLERMRMILALMQNRIFNWNIILMKNIITSWENCPQPVCLFVGHPLSTSMTNLKRARDSDKKINESAFVWPATRARQAVKHVLRVCDMPRPLPPPPTALNCMLDMHISLAFQMDICGSFCQPHLRFDWHRAWPQTLISGRRVWRSKPWTRLNNQLNRLDYYMQRSANIDFE